MATSIDLEDISKFSLEEALTSLETLDKYIRKIESEEPPSYDKEDYHYWNYEIQDAFYERRLITDRVTFLLDKELNEYFKNDRRAWSKDLACKILKKAVA
jgi:hypothetical protein